MKSALPKPNRERERRQKREGRYLARRKFAEAVFRRDKYRCINPDCKHSRCAHMSGLEPHHGLKKRPHNRDLDNPIFGVALCAGSGGCHERAENEPNFLLKVFAMRDVLGLPDHWPELRAELLKKARLCRIEGCLELANAGGGQCVDHGREQE